MFESNFPVDKLSCSYTVLWNQFKKLTKDFLPRAVRDVPRHRVACVSARATLRFFPPVVRGT